MPRATSAAVDWAPNGVVMRVMATSCWTGKRRYPPLLGTIPEVASGSQGARTLVLDELDAIAVGVAHEADARCADEVGSALGLHALLVKGSEGRVEVVDTDRDVPVARADLVRLGAVVVVRQLQPRLGITRVGEEVIR